MSYGIRTIPWQGRYSPDQVQVHHNYSRVSVQKQNSGNSHDDLVQQSSNFEPVILSSTVSNLEDFNQQQTTSNEFDEHPKILNAHTYGVRPFESERYVENSQKHRQYIRLNRSQSYERCNNKPCRVSKKIKRVEIHSKCPKGETGQFVYELSCNQYLNCWKGRGFIQNCAPGTLFNPKTLECDYAEKVYCLTGPRKSTFPTTNEELTEENQATCPEGFSGIIPHYTNCSLFLNCDNGLEHVMNCASGTLFDVKSNTCTYENQAECVHGKKASKEVNDHYGNVGHHGDSRFHSGYLNSFQENNAQNFVNGNRGSYTRQTKHDARFPNGQNQRQHNYQGHGYYGAHQISYNQHHGQETEHPSKPFDNSQNQYGHGGHGYHNKRDSTEEESQQSTGSDVDSGRMYDNVQYGSGIYQTNYNQHYGGQVDDTSKMLGASQNQYGHNNQGGHKYYSSRTEELPSRQFDNGRRPLRGGSQTHKTYQTNYDDINQEKFTPQGFENVHGNHHANKNVRSDSQTNSGQWIPNNGPYGQNPQHQGHKNNEHNYQTGSNTNDQNRKTRGRTSHGLKGNAADIKCEPNMVGLQPHPVDCSKFLNCANGMTYIQSCGPGTVFNPDSKVCDFPYNVDCNNKDANSFGHNHDGNYDATVGKNSQDTQVNRENHDQDYGESNINYQQQNYNRRKGHESNFDTGVEGHRTTAAPPLPQNFPTSYGKTPNIKHGQSQHRGNDLELNYDGNLNKFSTPSSVNYIYEYDDDIILDPRPDSTVDNLAGSRDICGNNRYACSENQCVFTSQVCDGIKVSIFCTLKQLLCIIIYYYLGLLKRKR